MEHLLTMPVVTTLVAVLGVLVGTVVLTGARQHSAREFVGAVMVLGSVAAIPVAAALAGLA